MEEKETLRRFEALCAIFPERLRAALLSMEEAARLSAQELRLRVGRPVQICTGAKSLFLGERGRCTALPAAAGLAVTPDELHEVFRAVCGYSVHSHQSEIARGFITFTGGHRVGLCGTAVSSDGEITALRDISSLNLRIARQVFGCADDVMRRTNFACKGILLAGAPGTGKTTILRDLARQLSSGIACPVKKVALVDERGELAAVWQGIPQNDVGVCTDILNGCGKREGILMAVRTLSPEIIICDEIGGEEDVAALKTGALCGVKLVASVHAATMAEVLKKPFVRELAALGAVGTVVLLEGREQVGKIKEVLDWGEQSNEGGGLSVHNRVYHPDGDDLFPAPFKAGEPIGGSHSPDGAVGG